MNLMFAVLFGGFSLARSRRSERFTVFPAGNVAMERSRSGNVWGEAPYLVASTVAMFVMRLAFWDNQFYHY